MPLLLSLLCFQDPSQGRSATVEPIVGFPAITSLAVGTNPVAVEVADFNLDLKPDIAVVNQASGDLSVLLNNGDRTFRPAMNHHLGWAPSSLIAADFNSDGIPDLAAGSFGPSGVLWVLLGQTNGTFQPPISAGASPYCRCVRAGDFNGDGKLDILTVHDTGVLSVHLNSGSGSFPTIADYTTALRPFWAEVADLNGDGKLDIAAVDFKTDTVVLLAGDGAGSFEPKGTLASGPAPVYITAANLDGDRQADLVVGITDAGEANVFLGRGDATFASPAPIQIGPYPISVALADFNHDKILDLAAVTSFDGTLVVAPGKGDGTFGPPAYYTAGGKPTALAAADFDGDGNCDVVVVNDLSIYSRGTASVLWGKPDGTFDAPLSIYAGTAPGTLAQADLNRDGHPDLISNDNGTHVQVQLGAGGERFAPSVYYPLGYLTSGPQIMADLDGDTNLDVAVPVWSLPQPPFFPSTYLVKIFSGASDGSFQYVGKGAGLSSSASSLVSADYNGDGVADLAATLPNENALSIHLGQGAGYFRPAVTYAVGPRPRFSATGDFNGDRRPDVAVAHDEGISILLGKPDGTFAPAAALTTSPYAWLAAADLDQDGTDDLVGSVSFGPQISVWLGRGGSLRPSVDYDVGWTPSLPVVADINRDGGPDIVVASSAGVSVLLGDAQGSFTPPRTYPVSENPQYPVIGDFNGDGLPDIAVVSGGLNRRVSLLLNRREAAVPVLNFLPRNGAISLTWSTNHSGFALESATGLESPIWRPLSETPATNNGRLELVVPFDQTQRFFRLHRLLP